MQGRDNVWSVSFEANGLEWERARIAASSLTREGRRQTDYSIVLFYGAMIAAAAVAILVGKWALEWLDLSAVGGISSTLILLGLAFVGAWLFRTWMDKKVASLATQSSAQELSIGPDFVVAHVDGGEPVSEPIISVVSELDLLTISLPRQRLVYVPARALAAEEFEMLRDFLMPITRRAQDQ